MRCFSRLAGLLVLAFGLAQVAWCQDAKLHITNLDGLSAKAAQTVDVNLDGKLLHLAAMFLSSNRSPEEAMVKEIVRGLRGVYVKNFEFDDAGQYSDSDVQAIRSQLGGPAWTRLVGVKCKRDGVNVEVYIMTMGEKIDGVAIIAAEAKALTVVNIVGNIDVEKISELSGHLGIPRLDIDITKPKKD